MSSPIDIVKVFYGTYSLMSADKAGHYLADEFQLLGFGPAPLNRNAWIGFLSALKTALPDLKIRLTGVSVSGDQVRFTEMGLGTHRQSLDLSTFGLPPLPADGAPVTFPDSEWILTVAGGKIVRAELVSPSTATGLPGMLKAFNGQLALTN